ncbi:CMGC/MAPK protein kinase, variant 2 [Coprinopsis cinerea AmutBmut pab1-1]|nr:CMGC/MAPK protein kinase, variant 2 [Coprinopsis cinerea AmutBmut pab1-1]
MRNQGRNRRSRNHKEVNDTQLNIPRDDPQVQSYSRHQHPSHYSDAHRLPSTMPSRSTYEVGRDRNVAPGRSLREGDWGTSGSHDRYGYDLYPPEHDAYDDPLRRDAGAWGGGNDGYSSRGAHHYGSSSHYKPPVDPYMEPNPYLPRSPTHFTERSPLGYDDPQSYYYEQWRGRDPRPSPSDEKMDYNQIDKRGAQGWRRSSGGGKGGQPKFQSDSGWSGRKKSKEWGNSNQQRYDEKQPEPLYSSVEDRSWEPADSWKSSNRHEGGASTSKHQQHHTPGRPGTQQQSKSSRKEKKSGKQKKEWKNEDLNLNNWTRRDHLASKKNQDKSQGSGSRKKHRRSRSRSRSRDSLRSHHSSYRSRSSSPVAKRRRRGSSPMLRSRSPEGDQMGWLPPRDEDRMVSRSPSPGYRRRSPSTSDRSSHRSRSPSPYERPRAVHRLPTANSSALHTAPATGKSKKAGKQRNGHKNARGSTGKQPARYPEDDVAADSLSMPPPPPPSRPKQSRQQTPDWRDEHTPLLNPNPNGLPPKPISLPEKPTRIVPQRNAGFKPIGQSNSALKMFFPGDEDEADYISSSNLTKDARTEPTPTKGFTRQTLLDDTRNGREAENPHQYGNDPPPISRPPASWDPYASTYPVDPRVPTQSYTNGLTPHLPEPPPHIPHRTGQTQSYWKSPAVSPPPESDASRWSGVPVPPVHPNLPPTYTASVPPRPGYELPYRPPVPVDNAPVSHTTKSTPQPSPIPISDPSPAWQASASASGVATPVAPEQPESKDLYVILNQVGEGTFGKVYKARNTVAKVHVALKRIRMETERDGFPVTAMREIKLLQSLKHPNVVQLYEMMVSNGSVFMVFEYMDHDLTGILSQTQFKFSDSHLKSLCHQMLAGLAYLHHKGVIHRDIKGSNILLNNRGELKLADFGLARFYQKRRRTDYTNRVITLWYRPPELLFGATVYGPEVDMWSAGCIMLELFTKKPVFQGNDEINQLHVIFKILGTPTTERWTGLNNLPWFELIKPKESLPNRFRDLFQKWMSPAALDLAERLLTYDPELRVSAQEAMEAPYFTQERPFAERPAGLASLDGEWHELETKQERLKKRKKTESTA